MLNVSNMFKGCSMLESVDFSAIPNVELAAGDDLGMFEGCSEVLVTCTDDNVANFEAIGYDDNDCIAWFVAPHSFYVLWDDEGDTSDIYNSYPCLKMNENFRAFSSSEDCMGKYYKNYHFASEWECPIPPLPQIDVPYTHRDLFSNTYIKTFDLRHWDYTNVVSMRGLCWAPNVQINLIMSDISAPDCVSARYWMQSDYHQPIYFDIANATFNASFLAQDCFDYPQYSQYDLEKSTLICNNSPFYTGSQAMSYYELGYHSVVCTAIRDNHMLCGCGTNGAEGIAVRFRWDYLKQIALGEVTEIDWPTWVYGTGTRRTDYSSVFAGRDLSKMSSVLDFSEVVLLETNSDVICFVAAFTDCILPKSFTIKLPLTTTRIASMFRCTTGCKYINCYADEDLLNLYDVNRLVYNSEVAVLRFSNKGSRYYSDTSYFAASLTRRGLEDTITLPLLDGTIQTFVGPVVDFHHTYFDTADNSFSDSFVTGISSTDAYETYSSVTAKWAEKVPSLTWVGLDDIRSSPPNLHAVIDYDTLVADIDAYIPDYAG